MKTDSKSALTQNLRDFTVQIRHAITDKIVGTGIAVSIDGKIVTCAHVFEAAAGVKLQNANGEEIGIHFPQARSGEEKARRAKLAACFLPHDDDLVLLQLVDGPAPLAPGQIPSLGRAEQSEGRPFRSYGYRRLDNYIAGLAQGTILGLVEPPMGRNVRVDPVQLESTQINRGMSGAAVLDTEQHLVVGIISETWFPDLSTKDRDTAWAVNARILSLDPLGLELRDEPLEMRAAPTPKTDIEEARALVAADLSVDLERAPAALDEWVGRKDFLKDIGEDWVGMKTRVTGLIGFGGEGKSSLARQWLDDLLEDEEQHRPDGVFWWEFYTKPSVDEFFEAALKYMGGGGIDPSKLQSANVRAQVLGAMLGAGRYIFVLDGLEVMQHEEGDKYGLLKSNDLRDFVQFFAGPDHESLCLITSRAPALDLMDYTTYAHRDVMRLSIEDGRALLTRLGVKGNDAELDRVVADWDGHALTLGLIGSHVAEKHDGDVAYASELDPPTVDESRYDGVRRVLRRYDEHLSEAERSFMKLFSAFRLPVKESAFEKIFRTATDKADLNAPIAALDDEAFEAMVGRLVGYRILRYDENACHYTAHPLIHSHYQSQLERCGQIQREAAHGRIKDYYLELAGDDIPQFPTLDDLAPLIEAVHHACKAGVYDEAEHIRWGRIDQGNRLVSSAVLGAYETRLALFLGFFPDGDTEQDPQVSDPHAKGFILNAVGFSLMNLGRMAEAVPFYESGNATALDMGDWKNVGRGYQNLAELHINLGALTSASDAAREALTLAKRAEDKSEERNSLAYQAWIAHLSGDSKTAGAVFKQAKSFERQIDPEIRFLYSRRGIHHADYLRRTGDADYARRVTEANMEICKLIPWPHRVSQCHRVLGDLDADAGHHDSARKHYDEALRIARSITKRAVLVEALLARGRWYARNMKESAAAFSDLNEALDYAVDGEYRIYEADIRIALSWAYLADGNQSAVRAEADRALNMSEDMGYHWGKVDAKEVLAELD